MKKAISLVTALLLCTALLGGCKDTGSQAYITLAKQVLDYFHAQDFAPLVKMTAEEYKELATEETWATTWEEILPETGAFQAYGETEVVTGNDAGLGDYVAVVVVVQYEKYYLAWQVLFNTQEDFLGMQIINQQEVEAS